MAKKKEISVEKKLRALYDLQIIDSRIDEIRNIRGELPLEVKDLEDEIEGFQKKIEKLNSESSELENSISLSNCNEIKFIFLILEIFLKFVNENDLLKSLLLFQQIAILILFFGILYLNRKKLEKIRYSNV